MATHLKQNLPGMSSWSGGGELLKSSCRWWLKAKGASGKDSRGSKSTYGDRHAAEVFL